MSRSLFILFATLAIFTLNNSISMAQVYHFRYYSEPNGYYNYDSYGNNEYSNPYNGYNFYNGIDMNQIMSQLNSLMEQFSSRSFGGYNNSNENYYNFNTMPQTPNFFYQGIVPKQNNNNSFVPSVPDISPAPSYESNPNIYY